MLYFKKLLFRFSILPIVLITLNLQASDKERIVHLNPKLTNLQLKFYIKSVIDVRDYKESIGFRYNIDLRRFEYYNFENNFEDELKQYFNRSLPGADRFPVNLKINYFFTAYNSKKEGWTKIKLEFAKTNSTGISSVFKTTTYGSSIESALDKALVLYQLSLIEDAKEHSSFDVVNGKKKGVYVSFEEFENNSPSILLDFDVISNRGEGTEFIVNPIFEDLFGYTLDELVWGVCDGTNVYLSTRFLQNKNGFYKLIELEDSYAIRALDLEFEDYNKNDKSILVDYDYRDIYLDFSYHYMYLDKYSGEAFYTDYKSMQNLLMNNIDLYKAFIRTEYDYSRKPYLFKDLISKYKGKMKSVK